MRIARGPIGLRYALVLLTVPGLAACGMLDGGADDQRADRANVSVAQTSPAASPQGSDAATSPSPRTTSETPASRKTDRAEPSKKATKKKKKKKKPPTSAPAKPKPAPTKPKPKPKPAEPAPGSTSSKAELAVLRLVNVEREKAGCKPLREDALLVTVARAHSKDMAVKNYFSHTSLDGRSPFDRMSDAGYKYSMAAENIAAGQQTPAAVMNSWMNSPGHRANILNCGLREIGVGRYKGGGQYGIYWTQNFGTPR